MSIEPKTFAEFRGKWIERALSDRDLSDGAFRTLAGLAHFFLHSEMRKIWAAQPTIAEKLNVKVRSLQSHLKELQDRGLIRVQRNGRDKPNDYFPIIDDAQKSADHVIDDTRKSAHQKSAMTRKIVSDDPQIYVAKTRKDLRTNTLKEHSEEYIERDGPFQGGHPHCHSYGENSCCDIVTSEKVTEQHARLDALESASVASSISRLKDTDLIPIPTSDRERDAVLEYLTRDLVFDGRPKEVLGRFLVQGSLTKEAARRIATAIDEGEDFDAIIGRTA